jgi:acetyltransferase
MGGSSATSQRVHLLFLIPRGRRRRIAETRSVQDFLPAARAEHQSFPSLPKQRIRPHTTSFAYRYTRAFRKSYSSSCLPSSGLEVSQISNQTRLREILTWIKNTCVASRLVARPATTGIFVKFGCRLGVYLWLVTYRLDKLFSPRSVAVVGASPRATSPGRAILRNLRSAGFKGLISLVNPHYSEIEGVKAVKTIQELPEAPDLLVIATPPPSLPRIIAAGGKKGAATAIIITAGLGHEEGSLAEACEKAARATGLRLVGPNCLGVLSSRAKLNGSFAVRTPPAGELALISQSGAITAGLIEWSAAHDIGFSAAVSLGDQIDVDFGGLLDFFALDGATRAILLYIESINNARKFMSAARAAARIKPVVVVKSGRHAQGAKAAQTHTGALAGADAVYDAAFRRAGLLRVLDLDELFAAAETLGRVRPFPGKRLAILTNGGGVGVLAVDRLADLGGTLTGISPETIKKLDAALPPIWSRANPVDIAGDADATRYIAAFEGLLEDRENDAILVMNVPTALASAETAAKSIAASAQAHRNSFIRPKPIFAVWVGSSDATTPIFEAAGIPSYATESDAVRGFMHLVRYREAISPASVRCATRSPIFLRERGL